jgi:hypothetical protein
MIDTDQYLIFTLSCVASQSLPPSDNIQLLLPMWSSSWRDKNNCTTWRSAPTPCTLALHVTCMLIFLNHSVITR